MSRNRPHWFEVAFVLLVVLCIVLAVRDYVDCRHRGGILVRGLFGTECLETRR